MAPFAGDLDRVIARALDALEAVVTVGTDLASSREALRLAHAHARIFATVGLHPHEAGAWTPDLAAAFREIASDDLVVAVGETGLDYHYDRAPRDVQRRAFEGQLDLARDLDLPVIIHSREAADDTLAILRAKRPRRGVMHCFSGDTAMARAVLDLGLHISIAGPVTFPKSEGLRTVAAMVPDDRLLLETDAPYLSPVPLRGQRNEPAHIAHTAREVARVRGVALEDVARMTTLNARLLLGLPGEESHGAIAYQIRRSLYLNITNRCTNQCSFCVRYRSDFVKGHYLKLRGEPSAAEVIAAIGDPARYAEVVFCGYGEPLVRLDVVKEVATWVKSRGGRVRINTNGQGSLFHGREVLPELAGLVDTLSVSLNAQDEETYNRLSQPSLPGAYRAVLDFIREASRHVPEVVATVVTAPGVDVAACRALAESLGATLRVRDLDVVG
jgi:TatD DNase family protein